MNPKQLAIIGGGFAGTTLARRLERLLPPEWELTLLSRDNHITYSPLLAEVVGASILPGHVVAPIRQMLRRTRLRDWTGPNPLRFVKRNHRRAHQKSVPAILVRSAAVRFRSVRRQNLAAGYCWKDSVHLKTKRFCAAGRFHVYAIPRASP